MLCPSHNFFETFSTKSFVVSRIIATFAVELECTEKNVMKARMIECIERYYRIEMW